jgi:hypothetical protein
MLPMRTPDEDGSGEETVSTSVGDGFGASADDLEDGFGDDDFSDDTSLDDSFGDDTTDTVDTDEGSFGDDSGDAPFGDGLSDAEAENVLVEILEDVFGADAPEVLDEVDAGGGSGGSSGDVFEALDGEADGDGGSFVDTLNETFGGDGAGPVVDDAFDPFEPTDISSGDDFDLTRDGHVDGHDLHEAAHPFDFGITE